MVHVELRLISTMAARGDFRPIVQGDVSAKSFVTDQGKIVFNFIVNYHSITSGSARWPSLAILRSRFAAAGFEFPDPDPGDTVDALVNEIRTQSARRDIKSLAGDLTRIADMPDPTEHLGQVVGLLRNVLDTTQHSKRVSLRGDIQAVLEQYDSGSILQDGIPWPWESLQKATRGMQRKEVVYFVGRPKMKKTFVALKVAAHAFTSGYSGIVFTPEMPPPIMLLRTIAHMAGVRYTELKNGSLSDEELTRLLALASEYGRIEDPDDSTSTLTSKDGTDLYVLQSANRSVSWMQAQVALLKPKWILIDSLYRHIPEGGRKHDADWKVVTSLSRSVKDFTMDDDIATIATHQLNKTAATKGGAAGLEDIAFADAISQDADLILQCISGILEERPRTAIKVLGGREVPFEGLLINSSPCQDFSEVGEVLKMSTIKKLMAQSAKDESNSQTKNMLNKAKNIRNKP